MKSPAWIITYKCCYVLLLQVTATGFNLKNILKENQNYTPILDHCSRSLRIFGGQSINLTAVPYQVALRRERRIHKLSRQWITFCGAAIITRRYVLTAAHCFNLVTLGESRVVANAVEPSVTFNGYYEARKEALRQLKERELWMKIDRCYASVQYQRKFWKNDVAFLKLHADIKWSDRVQPIPILPLWNKNTVTVNTSCLLSGYGLMNIRQRAQNLQAVCVFILSYHDCEQAHIMVTSSKDQMCASGPGGGCQGDSGGPLACSGYLVGVAVSEDCGNHSGVYTRLVYYNRYKNKDFVECSRTLPLKGRIIEITLLFVVVML